MDSDRNRPAELRNEPGSRPMDPKVQVGLQAALQAVQTGLSPQHVAECVFDAIRNDTFYIITPPDLKPGIRQRMEAILEGRNPA
jgi:hypothetical protein